MKWNRNIKTKAIKCFVSVPADVPAQLRMPRITDQVQVQIIPRRDVIIIWRISFVSLPPSIPIRQQLAINLD